VIASTSPVHTFCRANGSETNFLMYHAQWNLTFAQHSLQVTVVFLKNFVTYVTDTALCGNVLRNTRPNFYIVIDITRWSRVELETLCSEYLFDVFIIYYVRHRFPTFSLHITIQSGNKNPSNMIFGKREI